MHQEEIHDHYLISGSESFMSVIIVSFFLLTKKRLGLISWEKLGKSFLCLVIDKTNIYRHVNEWKETIPFSRPFLRYLH